MSFFVSRQPAPRPWPDRVNKQRAVKIQQQGVLVGSITSRCSRNESPLLPEKDPGALKVIWRQKIL